MKKRIVALLLAVLLLTISAVPALAAAPKVQRVEYEGNGVVEVDFTTENARYKSARVVVKDAAGKKLTAKIIEKDNDSITFKVSGLKTDSKYTFTISGVRAGKSGSYDKVKGSFKTPSASPEIARVEYDPIDEELEVDFATNVQFRNLKVTVSDAYGDELAVSNLQKGQDDLEMNVEGMVDGETYIVTVSGVRVKGKGSYVTVSKTFVA